MKFTKKKYNSVLGDFARKISDEELKFINTRLANRIGTDVAEAIETIERYPEIDHWLSTAPTAFDFYDMVDQVDGYIQQECKRRFS